jgi:hypothetical protein
MYIGHDMLYIGLYVACFFFWSFGDDVLHYECLFQLYN